MTRTSPGRQMFPEVFTKFLEDNDIDSAIYSLESDCRYIYVIDQTKIKQEDLFIDFPSGVKEVKGVPGFYRLQKPFLSNCIASSKLYNDGLILPLDTASGMAVHALEIKEGDHILDLCCAPGTKLVMMASKMGSSGTITGVDISRHRIFNVRALVKKYKVDNVRIYNENGTSFKRPIFLPKVGGERFKDRPFFASSSFRKHLGKEETAKKFSRVLVDAQCTHDGSIKHIRKCQENGWSHQELDQFLPHNLEKLEQLQYDLLKNGFDNLEPGGVLVYSTCSFSVKQNESVISRFLTSTKEATPLPFEGQNYMKRYTPEIDDCGVGFFIARITKTIH